MSTANKRGWEKKTSATNSISTATTVNQINNFIEGLSANDKAAHRLAFLHLMISMTGTDVTVDLTKKSSVTGVFHTSTFFADKKKQIVLKAIRSSNNSNGNGVENGSSLFYDFTNDCIAIKCGSKIELVHKSFSSEFQTDSSIKKFGDMTHLKDRQLQGVDSSWLAADTRASLESAPTNNKGSSNKHSSEWDQFETNKRLFNVNSSFDENLYTKKLDLSTMTKEQIARADLLAREIENTSSSNIHLQEERGQVMQTDVDEEDLYSGVIRTTTTTTSNNNIQKIDKTTKENAWKRAPPSIKISPDAAPITHISTTTTTVSSEPLTPPGIVISPKEVLNNTNATTATSNNNNKKNHKNASSSVSPNKINSIGSESKGSVEPLENELKKMNLSTPTTVEPTIPSITATTISATTSIAVETKAVEEKSVASSATSTTVKSGLNVNAKDWTPNVKAVEFVPKVFSPPTVATIVNTQQQQQLPPTMFSPIMTSGGMPVYSHPAMHMQPGMHLLPSSLPPGNIGINSAAVNGDQNPTAGFQPMSFDGSGMQPGMQSIPPPQQQFLVQQQPPMYTTDYMYNPNIHGGVGPMSTGMHPMMDFSPGGGNMMSMPMQMSPGGNIYGGPQDPGGFLNPGFMIQPGYGNQMMPHNMMNLYGGGFPPQQHMMSNPGMMNPAMQGSFNSPGYKYGGPGGGQQQMSGGGRGSKRGGSNYVGGNPGRGRGGPYNPGYNNYPSNPIQMSPMNPSSGINNATTTPGTGGGVGAVSYSEEIPGNSISEKETS